MSYKWQKYNWWIACTIITLAVFLILYYVYPNTDQDNARYILSAISQGLAAILALVFTITLVVAQMTRRYTAMDTIIFRPGTIGLMIIFGSGVVIPLLVLKTGSLGWGVNLSVALAAFCVFSLIPFLKDVNLILKYKIGVETVYEECIKAIDSGDQVVAWGKIRELIAIDKGAVKESCESVLLDIINYLSEIGHQCAEKRWGDATYWIVENLRHIGIDSAENRFKRAPYSATRGLTSIGVKAAKNRLKSLTQGSIESEAIEGLKDIGTKADERGVMENDLIYQVAYGLRDIAMELVELGYNYEYLAVNSLWWLGAFVTKYLPQMRNQVILNLKGIEKEVGKDEFMTWRETRIRDYPLLEAYFKDFKGQYDKT